MAPHQSFVKFRAETDAIIFIMSIHINTVVGQQHAFYRGYLMYECDLFISSHAVLAPQIG